MIQKSSGMDIRNILILINTWLCLYNHTLPIFKAILLSSCALPFIERFKMFPVPFKKIQYWGTYFSSLWNTHFFKWGTQWWSSLAFCSCLLLSSRGLEIHGFSICNFNENWSRLQNSDTWCEFIQEPFSSPECQLMGMAQ